jgi:hypothetical protein
VYFSSLPDSLHLRVAFSCYSLQVTT